MKKQSAVRYTNLVIRDPSGRLHYQCKFKKPLTRRQADLVIELVGLNWARLINLGFASEDVTKWGQDYERAVYGKIPRGEKERKAFEFLRSWRRATILTHESGKPMKDSKKITQLAPLLVALGDLDAEFFEALARAIRILEARMVSNGKPAKIESDDKTLDKWLLEYVVEHGLADGKKLAPHTVRELNQEFVSKIRSGMSDKKLREKCHSLGFKLKRDAQGTKAVRYGKS